MNIVRLNTRLLVIQQRAGSALREAQAIRGRAICVPQDLVGLAGHCLFAPDSRGHNLPTVVGACREQPGWVTI